MDTSGPPGAGEGRLKAMTDRHAVPALKVENVGFRRGRTILRDVSWSVDHGQHWCILGPNGCGKTTLINVISGYDCPSTGCISVDGNTFGQADWRMVRRRIGLVTNVLGGLLEDGERACDVVASGREAKLNLIHRVRPEVAADAQKLLRKVGCGHLQSSRWGVLSQGERQKVLICRALMARFRVLILDEPCAGLDPVAREHFLQWMQRLAENRNAPSMIMVTHHVEEILPCITHVLLMKNGTVFDAGEKRRVLSNSALSEVYGAAVALRRLGSRYQLRLVD